MALPFESIHDRVTNRYAFEDESGAAFDLSHQFKYGDVFGGVPLSSPLKWQFGYRSFLSPLAYTKRFKFKPFVYDCKFKFNSGLHQTKTEYLDLFAKMVSPIQKLANDIVRLQPGVAAILKRNITAGGKKSSDRRKSGKKKLRASRGSGKKKLSAGA